MKTTINRMTMSDKNVFTMSGNMQHPARIMAFLQQEQNPDRQPINNISISIEMLMMAIRPLMMN